MAATASTNAATTVREIFHLSGILIPPCRGC
jgi:hypothetical protein